MLRIECEEPTESVCACCQHTSTRLTRFVYKDDNAFAVYYVQFTRGHGAKRASGIIGLGEWGNDEVGPEGRLAFPFQLWQSAGSWQVALVNAAESPWRDVTYLGRLLDREEDTSHPWKGEVFHLTDHIVLEDQAVIDFFH